MATGQPADDEPFLPPRDTKAMASDVRSEIESRDAADPDASRDLG